MDKFDMKYLDADIAELFIKIFKIIDHQNKSLAKLLEPNDQKKSVSEPSIPTLYPDLRQFKKKKTVELTYIINE